MISACVITKNEEVPKRSISDAPVRRVRPAEALGQVLARANPHGVVVLDDVHLEPYFSFVRRQVPRTGWCAYTLERFTRDEGRRYSMLVMSRPIPA